MKIIKGFEAARAALSREVTALDYPVSRGLAARLKADFGTADPEEAVRRIIARVRRDGDAALKELTQRLDGMSPDALEVPAAELKKAAAECEPELLAALKLAAEQIKDFYLRQRELIWDAALKPGGGQVVRPLERVGLYVPGGTAAYPSTVLMTAIPAAVAGVGEIVLTTPPRDGGGVPAATLAAAAIAGVSRVFSVGGAQAIAALAYGTETIPGVDKICGPGNIFVMLAKKLVYGAVDIDGLQGPSEVLIIADKTADPAWCAADMLAQAEHDALAQSVLVTDSEEVAKAVQREVTAQMESLPRRDIAAESLAKRGVIALVAGADEAVRLANLYAPEHLIILSEEPEKYSAGIKNAGCIFSGPYASVAMGDYISGPSHVLPTGGTARFASPLNVGDFMKLTDTVAVDADALRKLGPAAALLARAEGLEGHARALDRRLKGG